jgi:BRCT domain type II-containing protein
LPVIVNRENLENKYLKKYNKNKERKIEFKVFRNFFYEKVVDKRKKGQKPSVRKAQKTQTETSPSKTHLAGTCFHVFIYIL